MTKVFKLLVIVLLFSSCSSSNEGQAQKQLYFFDLAGYFEQQASSLKGKQVVKTVSKNDASETKTLVIENWGQELQLFTESDINKAAWKDSYKKDLTATKLIYTTTDPELKIQKIEISFKNKVPRKIVIDTKSKNLLYHTSETLIFIPDSLYQITKHQKVILLGLNNYAITGKFK